MNHGECIAILLRALSGQPSAEDDRGAREHVARCSDCWAVLALVHELTQGDPPPGAERMAGLFACAPVQDELYLLSGLSAAEIRATHPGMATHLAWCHGCRDRLAELLAVERAAARGELGPPLIAVAPRWRETAARAGETVREVVGRAVVRVGRAAAAFIAVPDGVLISPLAPAAALRGEPTAAEDGAVLGRQVRFSLPDTERWAEVTLEPQGRERVAVAVRVSGEEAGLSVRLRQVRPGGTELVARHSMR